jgi:hypothetical protein
LPGQGGPPPADASADQTGALPETIGVAEMSEDGSIILTLRTSENGMLGEGRIVYPKSGPHYAEILKHVAPLGPGEQRQIAPFP